MNSLFSYITAESSIHIDIEKRNLEMILKLLGDQIFIHCCSKQEILTLIVDNDVIRIEYGGLQIQSRRSQLNSKNHLFSFTCFLFQLLFLL